tara:strand:- start:134 stop:487 length:354 start_codon:yes stop_codon:yes gene_type:complete
MLVNKSWGYEKWIENNSLYCGKHLRVLPDKWCSIHYHKKKKETFYVIEGELLLEYGSISDAEDWANLCKKTILNKGDPFTIEVETVHSFTSNTCSPCDFIEISTEHKDSDSYRLGKR